MIEEEKLKDLMNSISFALKDETLQQGFEIICKRISELEKENTELKAQIEKMKCCYNCKHCRIYFVNEIIVDCLANKVNLNNKFNNCDKWELAEWQN